MTSIRCIRQQVENRFLRKVMYKIEILEKNVWRKEGGTMKPRTVKLLADYLGVEMESIVQFFLLTTWLSIAWSGFFFAVELERVTFT